MDQIGKEAYYKIKEFKQTTTENGERYGIVIFNDEGGTSYINAGPWHIKKYWNHSEIKCVYKKNKDGVISLAISDNRHPHFEINQVYQFEVIGFKEIPFQNDKRTIICIKDKYFNQYEVMAIQTMEKKLNIGDSVKCMVLDINYLLKLKLVHFDDPFFFPIESFVKNQKLIERYFKPLFLTKVPVDAVIMKFQQQYRDKSGFWIFTFCNTILNNLYNEKLKNKNLEAAKEVNDLIVLIENEIKAKEIHKAFPKSEDRIEVKKKLNSVISRRNIISEVLEILIKGEETGFIDILSHDFSIQKIYYLIIFTQDDNLPIEPLIELFQKEYSKTQDLDVETKFYLNKINSILAFNTNKIENITNDHFILSRVISDIEELQINKTNLQLYLQSIILGVLGKTVERNLVYSQICTYSALLEFDPTNKFDFLSCAFSILQDQSECHQFDFKSQNGKIVLDLNNFQLKNLIRSNHHLREHYVKKIKLNDQYEAKIFKKHFKGFLVDISGFIGYLPYNLITDFQLRKYDAPEVDWDVNVRIKFSTLDFCFFIVEQIHTKESEYKSVNNYANIKPVPGVIVNGKIKAITTNGLLVSSIYGDGLIHISNISPKIFKSEFLSSYFKVGEILPIVFLQKNKGRLEFGLKQLIGTTYEKYYKSTLNEIAFKEINDFEGELTKDDFHKIEQIIENEKGLIFEQSALLSNNVNEKLNFLLISRQFYSNTSNIRSYLINIYIEYLRSIGLMDDLLNNYSKKNYQLFQNQIQKAITEIDSKTIETFSEAEILTYYFDIILSFNNPSFISLSKLFDFIKKYDNDRERNILSILAKITLANNLLLSENNDIESEEITDFSIKNLKRIRDYLGNGILTLGETIEDILAKEQKQKIKYWKSKIKEDEGERLEFKSTLLTPVPSVEQNKIILTLENELSKQCDPVKKEKLEQKLKEIKDYPNQTKRIIHSSLKSIAAFANTNGGHLLIGVSDNKEIFGLEKDYFSFKKIDDQNRDGFGKHFDNLLKEYFGPSFSSTQLEKEFLKFPEGDVLIINVRPSNEEVFLLKDPDGNNKESLYVRNLSSSVELTGKEMSKFIREKYMSQYLLTSGIFNK